MLVALGMVQIAHGHGLVVDPPSRNAYCGLITKPDQIGNGTAQYPECAGPYQTNGNFAYNFMSVATHDLGRRVVGPQANVCSFNTDFGGFAGQKTPWDAAGDWPTKTISAGRNLFKWDIQWGPHFDDTEEFVYYITKPGFQFSPTAELSWSDFEDTPFCVLGYNDANPTANPDVSSDKGASTFDTYCDVPARSGHHVIYAEWGRNYFTFERFHGCIDVVISGGSSSSSSSTSTSTTSSSTSSSGSSSSGGSSSTGSSSSSTSGSSSSTGSSSTGSSSTSSTTSSSSSGGSGDCVTVNGGQSGNFNTNSAYCFKTTDNVAGWGVSNFAGRTMSVTVNGTGPAVTTIGGALPAKGPNDYYHFNATAGSLPWASAYWWSN